MKGILTFSNTLFLIFFLISIVTLSPLIAVSLGLVYSLIYSDCAQSISSRINTIPLQIGIVLLCFTISLTTLMPIISNYAWWILFFIIFSFILSECSPCPQVSACADETKRSKQETNNFNIKHYEKFS